MHICSAGAAVQLQPKCFNTSGVDVTPSQDGILTWKWKLPGKVKKEVAAQGSSPNVLQMNAKGQIMGKELLSWNVSYVLTKCQCSLQLSL